MTKTLYNSIIEKDFALPTFESEQILNKRGLKQLSIRELITMGTPSALDEAWEKIQSEADCGQVENHPVYADYLRAARAIHWSAPSPSV